MNNLLTFDMILELPEVILDYSNKYNVYSKLLSKEIVAKYYDNELRGKVKKRVDNFLNFKYNCTISISDKISVTSNYEPRIGTNPNRTPSKVENAVSKTLDRQIKMKYIYDEFINCSKKLTKAEAIYFVDYFFSNIAESYINENLGYSRRTFEHLRKSCLIKIANELGIININF